MFYPDQISVRTRASRRRRNRVGFLVSRFDLVISKSETKKTAHRVVVTGKGSAPDAADSTVLMKFEWVYTKSAGIWYPKVAAGDVIRKEEQIGTVGDLFGDTLEKIISPVNGVILFLTINPSVLENGLLMGIGVD
jgi:predicted deacylase